MKALITRRHQVSIVQAEKKKMDPDDKTSSINLGWEAETTNLRGKKRKKSADKMSYS